VGMQRVLQWWGYVFAMAAVSLVVTLGGMTSLSMGVYQIDLQCLQMMERCRSRGVGFGPYEEALPNPSCSCQKLRLVLCSRYDR
jgi:hypothetical protein